MVMHARKPQRINDGYFEKHQTHPYQNSKYSSSKGSYGSGGERYERIRDSPNGNSYRSDSPDSQSPRERERAYQSKGSYLQKIREKERENRDYKMSREKYVGDTCRSPKEKRSRDSSTKDSEHRTNHDRSVDDKLTLHTSKVSSSSSSQRDRKPMHNCQDKQREDRSERVTRVGDWSEHISSSGKKYYYNCKTEVSQWEKPREWVERERERERDRGDGRFRGGGGGGGKDSGSSGSASDRPYGGSGRSHDKHSSGGGSSRGSGSGTRDKGGGGGSSRHWSNSSRAADDAAATGAVLVESHDPRRKHTIDGDIQATQQDMDISPGDSTPTSEMSYSHHTPSTSRGGGEAQGGTASAVGTPSLDGDGGGVVTGIAGGPVVTGPVLLAQALPRLAQQQQEMAAMAVAQPIIGAAAGVTVPVVSAAAPPAMVPPPAGASVAANAPGPPPVTLASLPRILSQITGAGGVGVTVGVTQGVGVGVGGVPTVNKEPPETVNHQKALQTIQNALLLSRQGSGGGQGSSDGSTEGNGVQATEGPPTPTHSESQDCMDARKSLSTVTSPPASLSSLQGVAALRSTGPTITPSLANYYRDDLVNHVRGWPADILEKQAQKLSEEAHIMGSLQCTKVSAELKSARSIVRLTEIQATLQEQRILFLRQQIKMLEDMKAQNSFMSDDV